MRKIFAILFQLGLCGSVSHAAEYVISSENSQDTVHFKSTAKLEFIEGTTNNIAGSFTFEPGKMPTDLSGIISVDLRTLKTGIETRDEHMRENHLHTDDYPLAYFKLKSAEPVPALLVFDSTYTTTATGNFYIHGHYREIEADLSLVRQKSADQTESIKVRAKFSINLDKFKISRPKALFLKLAETIEIEVIFTAYSANSPILIELPDWSKLD